MTPKGFTMMLSYNAKTRIKSENVQNQNSFVQTKSFVFPLAGGVMVSWTVGMEVMNVQFLMRQSRFKLTMI